MNTNWPRWLVSSIVTHFDQSLSYKTFVEAEPRTTWEDKDFIEIRVDGPIFNQLDSSIWRAVLEVNILVQAAIDFQNLHKIHTMVGEVAVAFTTGIQLYKYGGGPQDSQAHFGCLSLLQNLQNREKLVISHFGQIAPDRLLQHATVEGHFEVHLE
jgi:hypothetical protein